MPSISILTTVSLSSVLIASSVPVAAQERVGAPCLVLGRVESTSRVIDRLSRQVAAYRHSICPDTVVAPNSLLSAADQRPEPDRVTRSARDCELPRASIRLPLNRSERLFEGALCLSESIRSQMRRQSARHSPWHLNSSPRPPILPPHSGQTQLRMPDITSEFATIVVLLVNAICTSRKSIAKC